MLLMGLSFTQQEILRTNDFDAVLVQGEVAFHCYDDFFVVVRDLTQGDSSRSLFSGGVHGFCDLDVLFLVDFGGDEVHVLVIQLAEKV